MTSASSPASAPTPPTSPQGRQPSERRARIAARVGPLATVVDIKGGPRIAIDGEGRWSGLGDDTGSYRRTVDGRVLRVIPGGFAPLAEPENLAIHARAGQLAGQMREAVRAAPSSDVQLIGTAEALFDHLDTAEGWTAAKLDAERQRFALAYPERIPILPPHRYRDLVILPAVGCPNHTCSFCDFYRDRTFRALDDEAFERHLQGVIGLFGRAVNQRGGVFFGSGSALSVSDRVLLQRLARIQEVLGPMKRGIAAFHNPDLGKMRSPAAWRALRDAGLVDATLGLETGLPELRYKAEKSPNIQRFIQSTRDLKAGGVSVAITLLIGLGGESLRDAHREASVEAIAQMPLTKEDRVYLSPLTDAMPREAAQAEMRRYREALRGRTGAKVANYLVERYAYFA